MNKRDNLYISKKNDKEVEVEKEGADGRMVFCILSPEFVQKNTRNEDCIALPKEYTDLDDDMYIVFQDDAKSSIRYIEVWKLFFTEPVNIIMSDDYELSILVPLVDFKSFVKEGWMEWDGSNITWNSIKEQLILEEKPNNLDQQINLFYDAIRQAKQDRQD